MDNCDELNLLNTKLEMEELIIKPECDNDANQHSSSVTSKSDQVSYAVVYFRVENTYATVPAKWLVDAGTKKVCWWPPKLAHSAIKQSAEPGDNWALYPIELIEKCDTYKEALIKERMVHSADSNSFMVSACGRCMHRIKEDKITQVADNHKDDDSDSTTDDEPDTEINLPPATGEEVNCLINPNQTDIVKTCDVIPMKKRRIGSPKIEFLAEYSSGDDTIIGEELVNGASLENWTTPNIENILVKILKNVTKLKHELRQDLNILKEKVELLNSGSVRETSSSTEQSIKSGLLSFLPITTIDELKKFDELLYDESRRDVMAQILEHQGGLNSKDFVKRCLAKIFHVYLAKQCSWTGAKNNFRIQNLQIMKILEVVTQKQNINLREFEKMAMEWFRQQNTNFRRHTADLAQCQERS